MDVKTAIETGDAAALRRLLADVPARADELIRWGKDCRIATHPLHYVSDMRFEGRLQSGKELPLMEALIQAGAKTDIVERTGVNLLHWAAITNRADVVPELAKAGVDINAIDEHGYTPLMYAATIDFGDTATLRALIAAGADRRIKNGAGRTALQQARRLGHAQLANALQ